MYGSLSYDYSGRKRKKKKVTGNVYKKYVPTFKPLESSNDSYRRDSKFDVCTSSDIDIGVASRKESNQYTGTLVKGIATMHKSNAVPIIDQQQAIDIANMRRN
jgi:hypothetical protein